MPVPENLYFIAVIPPEPYKQEITDLKKYVANTYKSKKALTSPPHITLFPPFTFNEDISTLKNSLWSLTRSISPFKIEQNGFGCFPPKVIYLNVENNDRLNSLRDELVNTLKVKFNIDNNRYGNKPFTPHMTIAFKDLSPGKFDQAWPEFREHPYQIQWEADSISLLKHNKKWWQEIQHFKLGEG